MRYILFLLLVVSTYSQAIEYVDIYSQGIIKRYMKIEKTSSGVKVIPIQFKVSSFNQLFDIDNRDIQCTIGLHPPVPGKNVPEVIEDSKCKTKLMKNGDLIRIGLSIEPLRARKFKMYIPPYVRDIQTMKFFLAQNIAFTIAIGFNYDVSSIPECWNNLDYKSLCVPGTEMFVTSQTELNNIFKNNSYIVLEKYQSEASEPKFLNITRYLGSSGGYLYFKVLRNTFPGKVISKFETVMTVDAIPFVKWFRENYDTTPTIPVVESKPIERSVENVKPKPAQPKSKVDDSGIFGGAHRENISNNGGFSSDILDKINPKFDKPKPEQEKQDIDKEDTKEDKPSLFDLIINLLVSIFNSIISIFGGE